MNYCVYVKNGSNVKKIMRLFEILEEIGDEDDLIEQFKENPELVGREKTIIPVYRTCITCVKELTIEKYEGTRKECIECRRKKKKINYEKQFEEYKNAIGYRDCYNKQ